MRLIRRAAAIMAAAVGVLGLANHATAQKKDELSISATFGWQGKLSGDRWSPITISISSGEKPLSGTVTATYQQGAAGTARTTVPFAATPNATTPVHVIAWIPDNCMRIDVDVANDKGAEIWRQSFEAIGKTFGQSLPGTLGSGTPLILILGRSSLFEAARDWPTIVASSDVAEGTPIRPGAWDAAWTRVNAARGDPTILPTSWAAYDGLCAIAVTPDSSNPPDSRAVEAIHQWVASGGRLIIRVDDPGDAWRSWLPAYLADTLTVDSLRTGLLPEAARAAIDQTGLRVRRINESPDASISPAAGSVPAPVDTLAIRPIQSSPLWKAHWPTDSGNLLVETRHGFGAIVLLGLDPARTTTVMSATGAGAVWRAALEPILIDILQEVVTPGGRTWNTGFLPQQSAVNSIVERTANVPGVGAAVFTLIVICILLLALLVGPFDYFLLRRLRLLQRSWLTALAWAALAGAAAYAGPRLIRSESTRVNRITIEDCIADPAGSTSPATSTALAFRCGYTGIYSGDSGVITFTDPDRASWWRGAMPRYINLATIAGSGTTPTTQEAAGGALGSQRGGPLIDLPMAIWTFRAFADESSPPPTIRARVKPTDKGWSVLVSGLPDGTKVRHAALRIDSRWVTLDRESRIRKDGSGYDMADQPMSSARALPIDGGVWAGLFPDRHADPAVPLAWGTVESYGYYQVPEKADDRPGALTRLPGPDRRTRGIETMLATGEWAAIYLDVQGWPIDTPVKGKFTGEQSRILRIVAPVQQD